MAMANQDADADADTDTDTDTTTQSLQTLEDSRASVRLRAALAVGTAPDPQFVGKLIERCGVEPDFSVREILTWALTRHAASVKAPDLLPGLLREVRSEGAQARSQALHTLSKIGDRQAWPVITRELLSDADDEVARSAWRAAVVLVPEGEKPALATMLATQLGRGGREMQLSLSRALIALGEVILPILHAATTDPGPRATTDRDPRATTDRDPRATTDRDPRATTAPDPRVRTHALATQRLLRDPDAGFEFAIEEAKRAVALGPGEGQC